MKKMNLYALVIALSWNTCIIPAQQIVPQNLIIVPGQNGVGGGNVDYIFPQYAFAALKKKPSFKKHTATTPEGWSIDFGQHNCQSHVQAIVKNNELVNKPSIMHCSSQGTATGINFIAKNPTLVKAAILESVMLSGNSAIFHTVENMYFPFISSIPLSYYWLPYFLKPWFLGYSPAGEQAIFNADKLPTNLPIIILHNTKDFQLSFKDAQGLYAF